MNSTGGSLETLDSMVTDWRYEMIIGDAMELDGEIEFKNFLRVNGSFQGILTCTGPQGCLYIGAEGCVTANLENLYLVVIEGKVIGNIHSRKIIMKGGAIVEGDIHADSLEMGPEVEINGKMHVTHHKKPVAGTPELEIDAESSTTFLIIDPQVDFHEGGSLAVEGATADSDRLSSFISKFKDDIDNVFISLDSHHRMHIAHGVFWTNEAGDIPFPFTEISHASILAGEWFPRDSSPDILDYVKYYTQELENCGKFKLIIWPEHCLIGSPGHAVVPCLNAALQEWAQGRLDTVSYIMKGTNCLTEMYSALSAEVPIASDPSTKLDLALLEKLRSADHLFICGQALSHCVNFTIRCAHVYSISHCIFFFTHSFH
jgi:nicotinamidase-related amidase/cytoskeletal protein CcmA (bactofilin family)